MAEREHGGADDRIQDEVSERLAADPELGDAPIQVNVTDGEVTLTGTVDSPEIRQRSEEIAGTVAGVTAVLNTLRVRQPGGTGVVG